MHGVGATPRSLQQPWAALRRRLDKLRTLGPAYAGLEPCGTYNWFAPLEPLRRLHATVAGMVWATLRPEVKGHLREWRAWLEEVWTPDQGAVYQWFKDESYAPPVTFIPRPDGPATANSAEMDGLL